MTLQRHTASPILSRRHVPAACPALDDPSAVFNPGALAHGGRIFLLLRVQSRGRETLLLPAWSEDGVSFQVSGEPVRWAGLEHLGEPVHHIYDPRLTWLEGACHAVLAVDTDAGCRLAVARSDDFRQFTFLGPPSGEDLRNGVLFPRRVGGRFLRLERPNAGGGLAGAPGTTVRLAASSDLVTWEPVADVFHGRPRLWDEAIGSGPPPLATRQGWLHLYHGIATHWGHGSIYQVGAVLLDREQPWRVLARTRRNILEPRQPWELTGQVPNVVFPCGMVPSAVDEEGLVPEAAEVKVYYGAADTVVGLATARVGDLLAACEPEPA